jgi:hypothetical protein
MIRLFLLRILYLIFYLLIIIVRKFNKDEIKNSRISEIFIDLNNKIVLKRVKNVSKDRISILLPHCIQNYECPLKVTSTIENCKECGKCKVGDILKIQREYGINSKIATGGTLARKFLKETKPKLVIAIACERDLVSGIYDAFPMPVYGIFNKKINGPCFNTDISMEEIRKVLKKIA